MPEHSPAQKQYLLRVRRKKYMIHVSRILLFLGFLFLWEVSARRRWIDSFIFSSPSEIWQTFFYNDPGSVPVYTYRDHPDRNTGQFCVYCFSRDWHSSSSVVLSEAFADPGALPRRPKQSAKIRPCPTPDCMAGCKYTHNHCRRNVCGDLWLDHQSLHWLPRS